MLMKEIESITAEGISSEFGMKREKGFLWTQLGSERSQERLKHLLVHQRRRGRIAIMKEAEPLRGGVTFFLMCKIIKIKENYTERT